MPLPRALPRKAIRAAAYAVAWVVLAVVASAVLFFHSSATMQIASHDAVLRPNLSGEVTLRTGPVLPDVRIASPSRIGVTVQLGKTTADSPQDLVDRYAAIASAPDGPETRVRQEIARMAQQSLLRGAGLAFVPLLLWAAVGAERRRYLLVHVRSRRGVATVLAVVLVAAAVWQPWDADEPTLDRDRKWQSLSQFLGAEVPIPDELAGVQVRGDVTTSQTRRLVESAVSTYDKSKAFYADAARDAGGLDLREPQEGETTVLIVTDRHDNIGMDQVAKAVGDRAGATAVFDLGDDTSTGSTWEAFSLDSLDATFDEAPYKDERWAISGNHDNGTFVSGYLADHGWKELDGEVVDGPADTLLLGTPDPRASGLGNWRDEKGLTFDEVEDRLVAAACASQEDGERISTVIVHDANMASKVLDAGCADLVLGGHTHVRAGPTRVDAADGAVGYSYTTGTTGGAAYAIAVGSSIRRPADIGLVTYRDGRPVGIQGVQLNTNGVFTVAPYVDLTPAAPQTTTDLPETSSSATPATGSPGPT
jgi:predicted phosphodiesterase